MTENVKTRARQQFVAFCIIDTSEYILWCGYIWSEIISKLFQPSSTSVGNNFSACKLAWNYFKIISEAYCSSQIFSNMFNVA